MTHIGLIIGMSSLIYACRLAGFSIKICLTPYWERVLHLMPIAVFATLATLGLIRTQTLQVSHVVALLSAGVVAWRTRQIGLSVLVGLGTLWVWIPMGMP